MGFGWPFGLFQESLGLVRGMCGLRKHLIVVREAQEILGLHDLCLVLVASHRGRVTCLLVRRESRLGLRCDQSRAGAGRRTRTCDMHLREPCAVVWSWCRVRRIPGILRYCVGRSSECGVAHAQTVGSKNGEQTKLEVSKKSDL